MWHHLNPYDTTTSRRQSPLVFAGLLHGLETAPVKVLDDCCRTPNSPTPYKGENREN